MIYEVLRTQLFLLLFTRDFLVQFHIRKCHQKKDEEFGAEKMVAGLAFKIRHRTEFRKNRIEVFLK